MLLLSILLILSIILNIALMRGTANVVREVERYEEYFTVLNESMKNIVGAMRSIDMRGAFEADDEVGFVFKGLLGLINSLDNFIVEDTDAEKKRK